MINRTIHLLFAITFFISEIFQANAMHGPIETSHATTARQTKMKRLCAEWNKKEVPKREEKYAIDDLATGISRLSILEDLDFSEPLLRPHSLLFSWLARELHSRRNNPKKLYKFLSLKKLCKYPLALVAGYMRILNINPNQIIIEPVYNDARDGGFYRRVPLLIYAAADNNIHAYRILCYAGAEMTCADNTGRTVANFPDIKTQFLKNVLMSATHQQALVDYYLKRYAMLRDYRDVMLHSVIAELFLLQSTNPKLFRHITPEIVKNRIMHTGIIRDPKIDLACDAKTLEPFNRDILFNATHTLSLTAEFLRNNLALKSWVEAMQPLLFPKTSVVGGEEKVSITTYTSRVSASPPPHVYDSKAPSASGLESTVTQKAVDYIFNDLAEKLINARTIPDKLYAFLSSADCKRYPILLVACYMKLLTINPNQMMSTGKSLIYQTIADKNTNTYAILAAAGANIEMTALPAARMAIVADEYINNRYYQVTTPESQFPLVNFYLDLAKLEFVENPRVLQAVLDEITMLTSVFPSYFQHLTTKNIQALLLAKGFDLI